MLESIFASLESPFAALELHFAALKSLFEACYNHSDDKFSFALIRANPSPWFLKSTTITSFSRDWRGRGVYYVIKIRLLNNKPIKTKTSSLIPTMAPLLSKL